jgi:hypothetical protein
MDLSWRDAGTERFLRVCRETLLIASCTLVLVILTVPERHTYSLNSGSVLFIIVVVSAREVLSHSYYNQSHSGFTPKDEQMKSSNAHVSQVKRPAYLPHVESLQTIIRSKTNKLS